MRKLLALLFIGGAFMMATTGNGCQAYQIAQGDNIVSMLVNGGDTLFSSTQGTDVTVNALSDTTIDLSINSSFISDPYPIVGDTLTYTITDGSLVESGDAEVQYFDVDTIGIEIEMDIELKY